MKQALFIALAGCICCFAKSAGAQELRLHKWADRPSANTGDILQYTIEFKNSSNRDFTSENSSQVFITDLPPRGFDIDLKTAIVITQVGNRVLSRQAQARFESAESSRMVRFGPFNVVQGAKIMLHYLVHVATDTRPGQYDNRAQVVGSGGNPHSTTATARVTIKRDSTFDRSMIAGRVFCERGQPFESRFGMANARVYIDTGSYAITDAQGFYHFSNVAGGTHVVKLDVASIGDVRARRPTQLLLVGEGVASAANFAVDCVRSLVDASQLASALAPSPRPQSSRSGPVVVTGTLERGLTLVGQRVDWPTLSLELQTPVSLQAGAPRVLAPPPKAGFAKGPSFVLSRSGASSIEAWTLRIKAAASEVKRALQGEGDHLPNELVWDGLDDSGQALGAGNYSAEWEIQTKEGRLLSNKLAFAIAAPSSRKQVWPAASLFVGSLKAPEGSPALKKQLTQLAATLVAEDRVSIRVHWDGSGGRIQALARTQREALVIKELLRAASPPNIEMSARGRGSLELLNPAATAQQRVANRRVEIHIESRGAAASTPLRPKFKPWVKIEDQSLPIAADGSFRHVLAEGTEKFVLEVQRADGSGGLFSISVPEPPGPPPPEPPGPSQPEPAPPLSPDVTTLPVTLDFSNQHFQVGALTVPAGAFTVDIALAAARKDTVVPIIKTQKGRLLSPVEFALVVPENIAVKKWAVVVRDSAAKEVHRGEGTLSLPTYRWTGHAGEALLTSGSLYRARLEIELESGVRIFSPLREFAADKAPSSELSIRDTLFSARGNLLEKTKKALLKFVSRSLLHSTETTYELNLEIARTASDSLIQSRIKVAARVGRIKKYLAELGLPKSSFSKFSTNLSDQSVLEIRVVAPLRPSPARRLLLNGEEIALTGEQMILQRRVAPGQTLLVDLSLASGRRFVVPVAASSSAPQPAPLPAAQQEAADALSAPQPAPLAARPSAADSIKIYLPQEGRALSGRQLIVYGTADPRAQIAINGVAAVRDPDHSERFALALSLPTGSSQLAIVSTDATGKQLRGSWPVKVKEHELFAVALAEGVLSTALTGDGLDSDQAYLPGMSADSTGTVGSLLLHGRLAFYLKGRLTVAPLFEQVRLTAHIDTARERQSAGFFEQLVDPVRDAPIWGDSAQEIRDVNTRGKFYLRAQARDARLVFGAARATLGAGELFRYERVIDGASLDIARDIGPVRAQVQAFAASEHQELVTDINWYRSTGGSLYFLRNGFVLEGSEAIKVIVRDRDTGLVLSQKLLARNSDYTVDYTTGRVLLSNPVPAFATSRWLIANSESSMTPESGNPVYLEARYEHRDPNAQDKLGGGVYVRGTAFDRVSLGLGHVRQGRQDARDYELWGADAEWKLGKKSALRAEIAASRALDGQNTLSMDGGLSFRSLDHLATYTATGPLSTQFAYKGTLDLHVGELFDDQPWLANTRIQGFLQSLDNGFSAVSSAATRGRLKLGTSIVQSLGKQDSLAFRYTGELTDVPQIGPRPQEVRDVVHKRASHLTSLSWAGKRGRFEHTVEATHQRISSAAPLVDNSAALDAQRLGGAISGGYWVSPTMRVRAGQQAMVGNINSDPLLTPITNSGRKSEGLAGVISNAGVDVKLAKEVTASGDVYQRWTGDNSVRLGLSTPLGKGGQVYIREQIGQHQGRPAFTTVVGARDRLAKNAGVTYGEYHLENSVFGARNRALMGVGTGWQPVRGLALNVGYEHQLAFGGFLPDGTPVGNHQRNLLRGALAIHRWRRVKAALKAELRLDRGPTEEDASTLTNSDPRSVVPPLAVANHGGVALGAPLLLPPGKRVQILMSGAVSAAVGHGNTLFGRVRFSNTRATISTPLPSNESFSAAFYLENTVGWAIRPESMPWLRWITRYSYLLSLRPVATAQEGIEQDSHVLATTGLAFLPRSFLIGTKIALKRTKSVLRLLHSRTFASNLALLASIRGGYRLRQSLDLSVEPRVLFLTKSAGNEVKSGFLLEFGYTLRKTIRLGIGYNFSRFSDNELGDLERDGHGLFVRVTGQY